jgi:hypothetical protein
MRSAARSYRDRMPTIGAELFAAKASNAQTTTSRMANKIKISFWPTAGIGANPQGVNKTRGTCAIAAAIRKGTNHFSVLCSQNNTGMNSTAPTLLPTAFAVATGVQWPTNIAARMPHTTGAMAHHRDRGGDFETSCKAIKVPRAVGRSAISSAGSRATPTAAWGRQQS